MPRSDPELAALATLACPDQGGADLPRGPGRPIDPARLPPGFTLPADPVRSAVVSYALAQVGKPYVWGAKGPTRVRLLRADPGGVGRRRGPDLRRHDQPDPRRCPGHQLADAAPGDLLFIPGSFGTAAVPRHVGIYVGHGVVVDARNARRGVILSPLADWRDKVVAIRRVTPISPAAVAPAAG